MATADLARSLTHREEGRPINIVLLGPPAGGKGTQAEYMVARYGMVHISTGDLLRARSKFMPELAQFMDNGKLVPDDIVSAVLKERLTDADCTARGVLLDGFPRTREQAESLQSAGVAVSDVVHLNVTDEIVIERVSGRRIDPLTGKTYHLIHNPPPPEVQDRVIQRSDDTVEKVKRRLASYHEAKDAIVSFYGDLVKTVHVGGNATNAFPSEVVPALVFDKVREALEGDTYRGSVVRQELISKDFECGSYATSVQTIARYFEHSRFRMLQQGCLADAFKLSDQRVALRAQVVHIAICLRPLQTYRLLTWLEKVGTRAVTLSHAISQQLPDGTVEDVARGSSALVFPDGQGHAMEIPRVKGLRELVDPRLALKDHTPVNYVAAAKPQVLKDMIGLRPADCWNCSLYVAADEMDLNGHVREAACISYFERIRIHAAAEGGYKDIDNQLVKRGDTIRTYVAYMGFGTQGDRLLGFSWIFKPNDRSEEPEGALHLAFEICSERGDVLIGGSLMIATLSKGAQSRL